MKKIQVRCVKGFGVIGNLHNIEVIKPLSGFGYAKKFYCCSHCGELFVLDLNNPALKGSRELSASFNETCPRCKISLEGLIVTYPEHVVLTSGLERMDESTIVYDHEFSFIKEYWLLEVTA